VLFVMQRPDEAYKQFQLAADEDPASELPSVAMGWLFGQSGDRQKANDWMERALRESPDDARSHLGMAAWLMQQGELERGLAEARTALHRAPDSYEARLLCAFLAWSQADYSAAEEILQALHQENPDDLTVSCQLVLVLADQADSAKHELATKLSQANLESFPSSPDVRATTGWVYFRTGQFDKAEKILQLALSDAAGQPQTVYYLASVLAAQGRTPEAKILLEKVISASEAFVFRPRAEELLKQITEGPSQPVAARAPAGNGDTSP
jgi:tetratricopeptide (TPR) repeat protein